MNGQLIRLREYINDRFDESELRDLCFDVAVDYDALAGRNKPDKVRELILYLYRRQRLKDLIHAVEKDRGESLGLTHEIYEEDESTLSPIKPVTYRLKLPVSPATGIPLVAMALLVVAMISIWMLGKKDGRVEIDTTVTINANLTDDTLVQEAERGQPDEWLAEQDSQASIVECSIEVGPLITGRSRLGLVDHMPVQIDTRNPNNVEVIYSWRASCGEMSPSLHTRLFQSTYIAPGYAVSDEITVYVMSASCELIERTAKVLVTEPADTSIPANCVPGTEPVATPASSLLAEPVLFTTYTLQPGDTLSSLARRTDTPVALLLQYNYGSPFALEQVETVEVPVLNPDFCPEGQPYFVKEGDTVISIANTFGVSPEALRDLNNVDADYPLLAHSVICVPSD